MHIPVPPELQDHFQQERKAIRASGVFSRWGKARSALDKTRKALTEAEENAAWELHLYTRLIAESQIPAAE